MRKIVLCAVLPIVFSFLTGDCFSQSEESNRIEKFFSALDFDGDGEVNKVDILRQSSSVDLIVSAKGNSLQATLNSMFYISNPVENISYETYKLFITSKSGDGKVTPGAFARFVESAVPLCLGDGLKGHRVVGTTPEMFEKIPATIDAAGNPVKFSFKEGRNFESKDFFAAVLGSKVAEKLKLKVGDEFRTSHGTRRDMQEHETPFTVTGILKESLTPHDNVAFVNMEGFYLQEDHALVNKIVDADRFDDAEEFDDADEFGDASKGDNTMPGKLTRLPDSQREVTAILLITAKNDEFGVLKMVLPDQISQITTDAQIVHPLMRLTSTLNGMDDVSLFYSLKDSFSGNGNSVKLDGFTDSALPQNKK